MFAKPWGQRALKPGLFSKSDFHIDLRAGTITCPAGEVESFEPGETVHFDPEVCGACPLRANCTQAAAGKGRSVSVAEDEALQQKFRKLQRTAPGRAVLRTASPSSTPWPTSPPARATAPATSAHARTCSTCAAPLRSRTSKHCIGSNERQRKWR